MDKIELRKQMIKKRLDLSSEDHAAKSNLIISKLKQHPDFINAKTIGIYVQFPGSFLGKSDDCHRIHGDGYC